MFEIEENKVNLFFSIRHHLREIWDFLSFRELSGIVRNHHETTKWSQGIYVHSQIEPGQPTYLGGEE